MCRLGAGGRGKQTLFIVMGKARGGGGGPSPFWPLGVCAAEQGIVFRFLSLTGCPFGPEAMNRGCEFWRCAVYVCDKDFFFQHNLILFCQ